MGEIQSSTQSAVSAIDGMNSRISNLSEVTTAIAAAVEEQGAATNEIARNIDEVSAGVSNISQSINNVS